MTPDELRALRKSKHLSARQAASICGCSSYAKYETGASNLDSANGQRIISILAAYESPEIEGDDNRARLKRFLRERGWTLKEFAGEAGINWSDASHLHSRTDYLPGPRIHSRCLAIGLDLHTPESWRGELVFPTPANNEQSRAIVAYQREHQLYLVDLAKQLGVKDDTLRRIINGATPRHAHVLAAFDGIGIVWPKREPAPKQAPKPIPRAASVKLGPCGTTEQARQIDAWMQDYDNPTRAAQSLGIDVSSLLRLRRGAKPRYAPTREKLAKIGVIWEEEAARPAESKHDVHCACGAVLTRYRTVALDGVRMCVPCHRKFFRMED